MRRSGGVLLSVPSIPAGSAPAVAKIPWNGRDKSSGRVRDNNIIEQPERCHNDPPVKA